MVEPIRLKNIGQIASFPQIGMTIRKIFETTSQIIQYYYIIQYIPHNSSNTFKKNISNLVVWPRSDLVVVIPESLDFLKIRKSHWFGSTRYPKRNLRGPTSRNAQLKLMFRLGIQSRFRPVQNSLFKWSCPNVTSEKLPYKQIRSFLFWVDFVPFPFSLGTFC